MGICAGLLFLCRVSGCVMDDGKLATMSALGLHPDNGPMFWKARDQ